MADKKELALLFSFSWLIFSISVSLLQIPNHVQIVSGDFTYYIEFGNWSIPEYISYCTHLDTGYLPIGFFISISKFIGIIPAIRIVISALPAFFLVIAYLILEECGKKKAILFSALSAITLFLYVTWCGTIKSEFALCFILLSLYFLIKKDYKLAAIMAVLIYVSNVSMAFFATFTIPILALYLYEFEKAWKFVFIGGMALLLIWLLFGPLIERTTFPAIYAYQENRMKLLGVVLLLLDLFLLILMIGMLDWKLAILLAPSFSGITMATFIMMDGWNLRHFYMAFVFSYMLCAYGSTLLERRGKASESRAIQGIFIMTFILWLINMGLNIYGNWP